MSRTGWFQSLAKSMATLRPPASPGIVNRQAAAPHGVQRLVDFCKETVTADHLEFSSEEEAALASIMSDIPLEALGFPASAPQQPEDMGHLMQGGGAVTYMPISDRNKLYTIGIFLLKSGATLPLHNHPGMAVYSRLLFGKMHVMAYDWVEKPAQQTTHELATARLVTDGFIAAPHPVTTLYPAEQGNVHTFKASTPAAFLDVLVPPYDVNGGRDCVYYQKSGKEYEEDGVHLQDLCVWEGANVSVKGVPYTGYELDR